MTDDGCRVARVSAPASPPGIRPPSSALWSSVLCYVLRAVIRLEIIADGACVLVADRRTERLDHLGDRCVPLRRREERGVDLDVVEAVAGATVRLDDIEPRTEEHTPETPPRFGYSH